MSPIWYELAGSVFGFAFACSLLKAGYLSLKSYEVSPGGSLSGSVQQGEHDRGNFMGGYRGQLYCWCSAYISRRLVQSRDSVLRSLGDNTITYRSVP